jgi:hypothetical protein
MKIRYPKLSCQCIECGEPLVPPMRAYCSMTCRYAAAHRRRYADPVEREKLRVRYAAAARLRRSAAKQLPQHT